MPVPLLIGAVVAGTAISAIGTAMSVSASQKAAAANEDIAGQQKQANQIALTGMEVDARRRQLETIRQAQIGRATSTAVATSQNAQLGSGLQGGLSQVTGQSNYNLLGINQNLDLGKEMAAVNNNISNDRISLARAEGMMGFGSGFQTFGNTLVSNASTIGRLGQFGFGK